MVSTVLRFVITSPIARSRSARVAVNCAGLAQNACNRAALSLEHCDQGGGDVIDLVRIQRLEQRLEAADRVVEVKGLLRAGQWYESARRQHLIGAGAGAPVQVDIALTDQVRIANLRPVDW